MTSAAEYTRYSRDTLCISRGLTMDSLGKTAGAVMKNFSCVSSLVTTAEQFISLPVAARVRMANTGNADSMRAWPVNSSQTSPAWATPAAIAFTLSSTEPPPTLRMASTCWARARAMPSRTVDSSGLLTMPPSSTKAMPCSARRCVTTSNRPSRLIRSLP